MTVAPDTVLRRGPALWRSTIDAVLVRVIDGDDVVRLGGSGVPLWAALDEPRTFAEVCDHLASAFGVEAAQVAADLEPVIDDLLQRRVVLGDG